MDPIKINITKKQEILIDTELDCVPRSSITCLVGRPGSGKTSYLRTVLTNPHLYLGKLDYLFIISPSAHEYKDLCPPQQMCTELSMSWVSDKINMVNKVDKDAGLRILFILDDVVGSMKDLERDKTFISFFFNRRHICWSGNVSIMFTTQKYTAIPSKIRSAVNWLVICRTNMLELNKIYDEQVSGYTKKEWEKEFENIFTGEYSFAQFDINCQKLFNNFTLVDKPQIYKGITPIKDVSLFKQKELTNHI